MTMVIYLLRQIVMFTPVGLVGLGVAAAYFALQNDWLTVLVVVAVGLLGLVQFAIAKYCLKVIEDRDLDS